MIKIASKIDLTGRQFGNLIVIKDSGEREKGNGNILWECQCQCENKTILVKSSSSLKNRKFLSCGCQKIRREMPKEDLSGMIFGRWKVLRFDRRLYDKNKKQDKYSYNWICECQCENHTIKSIDGKSLKRGDTESCGCLYKIDLKGEIFGRWKVLRDVGERDLNGRVMWECQCSCDDKTIRLVKSSSLIDGSSMSCGCINKEIQTNNYDLTGEYGIGWTSNTNEEFYFDLEDYDLIKNHCWSKDGGGYISTTIKQDGLFMHRLIMNLTDKNLVVDHVYHNTVDNRKSQLRIATRAQNSYNRKPFNNCKITGVYLDNEKTNRWSARMSFKGKKYYRSFKTFEEAVAQRKSWEEEFYGEFGYQEPPLEYLKELELN